MKKFVTVISVMLLIVICASAFVACKPKDNSALFTNVDDFALEASTFGAVKPTAAPTTAINKNMSAEEMFWASIENFYGAEFAMSRLTGYVDTEVLGLPVTQWVVGTVVRDGKADAANARYFVDNKSMSTWAKVYEETIVDSKGVRYRNGSKNGVKTVMVDTAKGQPKAIDTIICKNLQDAKIENFASLSALVEKNVNDPTKIWMYDISRENAGCIKTAGKPVYDAASGTYRFGLLFDISKATKSYIKVMEHMLNLTVSCTGVECLGIKFNVVVHESGFLRELNIKESYRMKVFNVLDAPILLESRRQFSYDKAETVKIGLGMNTYQDLFARF
ncbi:MAG: hypothetical protein RSB10_01945 [Clostridia bacterium]